jgi:hypothetical protein
VLMRKSHTMVGAVVVRVNSAGPETCAAPIALPGDLKTADGVTLTFRGA